MQETFLMSGWLQNILSVLRPIALTTQSTIQLKSGFNVQAGSLRGQQHYHNACGHSSLLPQATLPKIS